MHAALRLAMDFDPACLRADLDHVLGAPWTAHFNTRDYDGDWSGLALRGPADAQHPIQALHNAPGVTDFADQPVLGECSHFRAVMDRLPCPLTSVRLLRLGPGAVIAEHQDHELGFASGEARLHIPIATNPDVDFRAAGWRIDMRPGELWYLDASQPHSVANRGAEARIHLVLDCKVNDWLRDLLAEAAARPHPGRHMAVPVATPVLAPPESSETVQAAPPAPSRYADPITARIIDFLEGIGLEVGTRPIARQTLLPGIEIEAGVIWVDPDRLLHPGDLLNEAGHIAVTPEADRPAMTDKMVDDPAGEMMAIAWSWAAMVRLGLAPDELFHPEGYKGDSQWLIETYGNGTYIALPMLQWIGLTADAERAGELGVAPYPHMLRWLRA